MDKLNNPHTLELLEKESTSFTQIKKSICTIFRKEGEKLYLDLQPLPIHFSNNLKKYLPKLYESLVTCIPTIEILNYSVQQIIYENKISYVLDIWFRRGDLSGKEYCSIPFSTVYSIASQISKVFLQDYVLDKRILFNTLPNSVQEEIISYYTFSENLQATCTVTISSVTLQRENGGTEIACVIKGTAQNESTKTKIYFTHELTPTLLLNPYIPYYEELYDLSFVKEKAIEQVHFALLNVNVDMSHFIYTYHDNTYLPLFIEFRLGDIDEKSGEQSVTIHYFKEYCCRGIKTITLPNTLASSQAEHFNLTQEIFSLYTGERTNIQ